MSAVATLTLMSWQDTPCKLWDGYLDKDGYGKKWDLASKNNRPVHRLAWIEANGPIPPETPCVLHRCDTPACYEIEHLFLGTHQDNIADKVAKGRARGNAVKPTHCKHGHPFDEVNTYHRPDGKRDCKTCKDARSARARGE